MKHEDKTKVTEEWFDVTLVDTDPDLEALRPVAHGIATVTPSDLDLLPDVHPEVDDLEGMCSGCGEAIRPNLRGGWTHVEVSDPWHPAGIEPIGPMIAPAEQPAWLEVATCSFGHNGSRVEACDRDACEGSAYCAVHEDIT